MSPMHGIGGWIIKMSGVLVAGGSFFFVGNAQEFRFGLFGEGLLSWFSTDEQSINTKGVRVGAGYGLWVEYFFAENYGIATGVSIAHLSGIAEYSRPFSIRYERDSISRVTPDLPSGQFPQPTITYGFQYVEIPFTFKFRTNELGYIRYFGQFGVSTGILWRARAQSDEVDVLNSKRRIYDARPINFQLIISGGFEYTLAGNTALLVRIGYFGGFVDVTGHKRVRMDQSTNPPSWKETDEDNGKIRFNSVRLTVGILF